MSDRTWFCACSSYLDDDPGSVVCWRCEQPLVWVDGEETNDVLVQNLLMVLVRYRRTLEDIEGHFAPGDERRTYSSDIPGVMDRIRAAARTALNPPEVAAITTKNSPEEGTR